VEDLIQFDGEGATTGAATADALEQLADWKRRRNVVIITLNTVCATYVRDGNVLVGVTLIIAYQEMQTIAIGQTRQESKIIQLMVKHRGPLN
jgi:hypothetical protein